jgi:AraC-like DNA-binding protein
MDKNCVFMDRIAEFVSCSPAPPLFYAALQRTRSFNNPSPLAGLIFQARGDFGEWRVAGKPWFLPENHLSIGCCHHGSASPEPAKPVELWAVAFNLEGISAFDFLWEVPVRETTPVSNPARLTAAFEKTANRFSDPHHADPLLLKASLLELFAVARSEFTRTPQQSLSRPDAVTRAIEWMGAHSHAPEITLDAVAAAAGLSLYHFGRTFRETMGMSPMQYLRELRVCKSCGLLQGTALRINEIAHAVGFRDPLHFSRVFHEINGISPLAFRKEAGNLTRPRAS